MIAVPQMEKINHKEMEMYNALLSYAKKEGLRLIEAELKNEGILAWFYKEYIVFNKNYHRLFTKEEA